MVKKKSDAKVAENSNEGVTQVRMEWARTNVPVLAANAFYFTYQNEYAVMFAGQIDPLDTYLKEGDTPPEKFEIVPHTRLLLTPSAFMRLKSQVDEVYDGMKKRGVFDE